MISLTRLGAIGNQAEIEVLALARNPNKKGTVGLGQTENPMGWRKILDSCKKEAIFSQHRFL